MKIKRQAIVLALAAVAALWAPEVKAAAHDAARFRDSTARMPGEGDDDSQFGAPKLPDARIITGSERQNAVLLLIPLEDDKQFTLLPMVRLESKWYITDPAMRPRNIIR